VVLISISTLKNSIARSLVVRRDKMASGEGLSTLEVQILNAIRRTKSIDELAKIVKVPPVALGREIARLQIDGYLGPDGKITEKGLQAVR